MPTAEEFLARCVYFGIGLDTLEEMTLGMAINYIRAAIRFAEERNGKKVIDPEARYRKLKKLLPLVREKYGRNEISKKKYDEFIKEIEEYEAL